jgi:Putative Actinobacterial Holin-X, holin superfamily III
MVQLKHMPKVRDGRLSLTELLQKLASDGKNVAESEMALARAEIGVMSREYLKGIVLAAISFASAFVTLFILAQTVALYLERIIDDQALAFLLVTGAMIILTVLLAVWAKSLFTLRHQPVGSVMKWLIGSKVAK